MNLVQSAIAEIYALSAAHKITATDLANQSGISRVTLSNWRNGRNKPTLEAYLQVKQTLDCIIKFKASN